MTSFDDYNDYLKAQADDAEMHDDDDDWDDSNRDQWISENPRKAAATIDDLEAANAILRAQVAANTLEIERLQGEIRSALGYAENLRTNLRQAIEGDKA